MLRSHRTLHGLTLLTLLALGCEHDKSVRGARQDNTNTATTTSPSPAPPTTPPRASEESLRDNLTVLAREIGERHTGQYESLQRARGWINDALRGQGFSPTEQVFTVDNKKVANIVAEIKGEQHPEQIVILGAHYDTARGTPGADDNGTGVVALLEIAGALAKHKPSKTIRFVFFTNEEPPYFQTEEMGSLVYARQCASDEDEVVAMLSLEMLGYYTDAPDSQHYPPVIGSFYPDEGNFLAFVGNRENSRLTRRVHRLFEGASELPSESLSAPEWVQGIGFSDQWSFWQVGYPGVMVTDTAFMRNGHYHEPTDTTDTIDFTRLTAATDGLIDVAVELAK